MVFLGQLFSKDDDVVPEECYTAKRFNFLRWADDDAIAEYRRALAEKAARCVRPTARPLVGKGNSGTCGFLSCLSQWLCFPCVVESGAVGIESWPWSL
jgi:hypothetical protein